MASNPTTKSQVHAYKFVLRRMQSALVRRDSVMLHDPMRTHTRATIVGAVLSALGLLGVIIFSMFSPAPAPPGPGSIVIAKPSGQMYVVTGKPKKLIPTFNLASARLILLAQQRDGKGGLPSSGGSSGSVSVVQPEVIPDNQLTGIPKGPPTGILRGPPLLPKKKLRISPHWAVCDNVRMREDLPGQVARERAAIRTTVVAGVSDLGRELRDNEALLVESSGEHWLIYRLAENPNHPHADVVRAKVNLENDAVTAAYGLAETPRQMSRAMLDAIPMAPPIQPPEIEGDAPNKWGLGLGVGSVFFEDTATGNKQYWVITKGGIQSISKAVADLIRASGQPSAEQAVEIPGRRSSQIADIPVVTKGDPSFLPEVRKFPDSMPVVLKPSSTPVSCLAWNITGEKPNRTGHTTVYVNRTSPVPKDKAGNPESVKITQESPDGYKVDRFYMPPGHAAVVRSVTSPAQFGKGPIQLVSDQGIRYGVPVLHTAKVLGLAPQDPAPELILRLLPTGKSLTISNALRTWPPKAAAGVRKDTKKDTSEQPS